MPSQCWAAGGEEQRRGRCVVTDIDVTFSAHGDAGTRPNPASCVATFDVTRLWQGETFGASAQFLSHRDDEGNVSRPHG